MTTANVLAGCQDAPLEATHMAAAKPLGQQVRMETP